MTEAAADVVSRVNKARTMTMTVTLPLPGAVGAVILAAGKGTRMHSEAPKVLQRILDEPMLRYVYDAVSPLCAGRVHTIIGHGAEAVRQAFPEREGEFILQAEQLGTGHALQVAWPEIVARGLTHVLVINGDTPLVTTDALARFAAAALEVDADIAFVTLALDDPAAFGRVVRKDGQVAAVIEAKEYDPVLHGQEPNEINAGVYCFRVAAVGELLPRLSNVNKSGELYITDLVGLGVNQGLTVHGHCLGNAPDFLGINTPFELVCSEERLRERIVESHRQNGVCIRSPQTVRIGPDVRLAPGVDITGPCECYGRTNIAAGARIASHCRLRTADVGAGVTMHSFCHIQEARIGDACIIGPYARLRPGAVLEEQAHVGNFVEVKKSRLGRGAKANHLAYLGDADIGPGANIGAGTITCNYDGKRKNETHIGEKAFIGSNTALVAPVRVGDGALVGAGSVITQDVPDGHLGITRPEQHNVKWLK